MFKSALVKFLQGNALPPFNNFTALLAPSARKTLAWVGVPCLVVELHQALPTALKGA